MIRLSRLADYAVVAMTHIATRADGVHNAVDVAQGTGLPVPTVSKVLAKLCRGGLLTSQRGAKGGYTLSRPAGAISVAAIVSALDGPIGLTQCTLTEGEGCDVERVCPSRQGVHKINLAMRRALEDVSLADILPAPIVFSLAPNAPLAALQPTD
jgi:FeS assembly SUF system regulator